MGNGESRFSQRRNDIDDLNTVGINYVGGHGYNQSDFDPPCPIDQIVAAYGNGKEPTVLFQLDQLDGKAKDEGNMHHVYIAVLCSLMLKKLRIQGKFSKINDPKAYLTGQKYIKNDAQYQIQRSIKALIELSGIKGGDLVEKECIQAMEKKKIDKDKKKHEELEKGKQPKEKKPKEKTIIKEIDDENKSPFEEEENIAQYKGWENFPNLCAKIVTENPYLFDSIKCETLRWEFRQKDKKKFYKKEKYMGPLAGIFGEVVRCGQAAAKEIETLYLVGELGAHDVQGLLEMHSKDDRSINDKKSSNKDMEMTDKPENENQGDGQQAENGAAEPEKEGGSMENKTDGAEKNDQEIEPAKDGENNNKEKEEKKEDDKVIHKILFPGVTRVYSSQEEALEQLNFDCQSKQENICNVIIQVDDVKAWTGPKSKKYVHRLFCQIGTHETFNIKQKVTTVVKKAKQEKEPTSGAAEMSPPEDEIKEEVEEHEEEKMIHLFKMKTEQRDFLMTMEQWDVMKKNNASDEPKDLKLEEIDDSEKAKYHMTEQKQETVKDSDEAEEEHKECSIF